MTVFYIFGLCADQCAEHLYPAGKSKNSYRELKESVRIAATTGADNKETSGSKGSVYFLTETQAPLAYTKLEDDIIFRISAIGVPELISDSYNGRLVETEDSYIYTLSVPNERKNTNKILTVRKVVSGGSADPDQSFAFTLALENAGSTDAYEWYKNGVAQTEGIHSGDTFYLKNNETVEISVPQGTVVTVSESGGEYSTTFKLDDAEAQETRSLNFTVEDDTTLVVTNMFEHIVPTGVFIIILFWGVALLPAGFAALFFWAKKKRYHFSIIDRIMQLF